MASTSTSSVPADDAPTTTEHDVWVWDEIVDYLETVLKCIDTRPETRYSSYDWTDAIRDRTPFTPGEEQGWYNNEAHLAVKQDARFIAGPGRYYVKRTQGNIELLRTMEALIGELMVTVILSNCPTWGFTPARVLPRRIRELRTELEDMFSYILMGQDARTMV